MTCTQDLSPGDWEAKLNHRALLSLIAIVLLTTVGCLPRHPPHTPQPLGMKDVTGSSIVVHRGP
jgi:hypothetical protein